MCVCVCVCVCNHLAPCVVVQGVRGVHHHSYLPSLHITPSSLPHLIAPASPTLQDRWGTPPKGRRPAEVAPPPGSSSRQPAHAAHCLPRSYSYATPSSDHWKTLKIRIFVHIPKRPSLHITTASLPLYTTTLPSFPTHHHGITPAVHHHVTFLPYTSRLHQSRFIPSRYLPSLHITTASVTRAVNS